MTDAERKRKQRSNPAGYAKSRLVSWKLLGIKDASYSIFLERLAEQNYQCAICGCSIDEHASFDHNHRTGFSRGVLCQECNLILGRVEQQKAFLANAATYLEHWEAA